MKLTHTFILPMLLLSAAQVPAQEVVPGVNQFSAETYRRLAAQEGNFVASPFSIHNALSMALAGARGNTAAEIAAVLQQAYPDASYPEQFAALLTRLKELANEEKGTQLNNAAGLWVERSFPIEAEFQQILRTNYGAAMEQLDFRNNAEESRGIINAWTEAQTNNKIRELFAEGSLDDRTRLVLTTAIYFMGKWQSPFNKDRTTPGDFHLASGETANAQFMNQLARAGYAETSQLQILELKYAGSDMVFDILLPKSAETLVSWEDLSGGDLKAALEQVQTQMVEMAIPRFRIESGGSVRAMLASLGMPTAFTEDADFSGIDGARDLMITDVVHKAFIDVNEDGTEAAAATGVSVGVTSIPVTQRTFRADHPFAFLLRDARSGVILFTGRVSNPQQ